MTFKIPTFQEISDRFQALGGNITPDEVQDIVANIASKFRAIYPNLPADNDELLELFVNELNKRLENKLVVGIMEHLATNKNNQIAIKVYKIRNKESGLFKSKAKGRTIFNEDGDTYAHEGIAKAAFLNTIKRNPQLKDKLEIVTFVMFEVK